jgi:hypothetical protein
MTTSARSPCGETGLSPATWTLGTSRGYDPHMGGPRGLIGLAVLVILIIVILLLLGVI